MSAFTSDGKNKGTPHNSDVRTAQYFFVRWYRFIAGSLTSFKEKPNKLTE